MNQLLSSSILKYDINFKKLKAEDFIEALDILLPKVKQEHEYVVTQAPLTYKGLFENDKEDKQLSQVFHILSSLNMLAQNNKLRKVYEKYTTLVAELSSDLGLDVRLYDKIKLFTKTSEYESLDSLKKKAIEDIILNYDLGGIGLPQDKKDLLKKLSMELSDLTHKFDNNVLDAQAELVLVFDKEDLTGLSERALGNMKVLPSGKYEATYVAGNFTDILDFCDNPISRKKVYDAEILVGVKDGLDNRPILRRIVEIKQERAKILGFENYAQLSLTQEMVKTPEQALSFINELGEKSITKAKAEWLEVEQFGTQLLGHTPNFSDRTYIVEKFKKATFELDSEASRKYFPVKKVVNYLFKIIEDLYSIKFEKDNNRSTWNKDVDVFDLVQDGKKIGTIFMDLYQREHKEGGAWMDGVVTRSLNSDNELTLPVAHVVCNTTKDVQQESTFEFDELITLFHEMGHALHHLLTKVDNDYFSGLNNVEHDAVELPSQFMENFCWDYEILKKLSSHIETGETFPYDEYQKLLNGKFFLAAVSMINQICYSQMDMRIYNEPGVDPLEIEKEVFAHWKVKERDSNSQFLPEFSHIFSGGYAAGYYAYKWAEVLSTDAFYGLKESGESYLDQKQKAQEFREAILETGGTRDMMENFIKFRGREPKIDFLLESYGIDVRLENKMKM